MGQEGASRARSFPRAGGSKQHKLVFLLKQQKPTLSPSGDRKSESRGLQGHAASVSRGASCLPLPTVWRPQKHLAPPGLVGTPLLSLLRPLLGLVPVVSPSVSPCPVGLPVIEFRGYSKQLSSHLDP